MRASDGFNHKDLNGVSGWLVFPTIATFLMPVVALKEYVEVAIEYSKHPVWSAPMYTLFSVVTAAIAVQLGAQAYAIYCWLKRSASYPLAYIAGLRHFGIFRSANRWRASPQRGVLGYLGSVYARFQASARNVHQIGRLFF